MRGAGAALARPKAAPPGPILGPACGPAGAAQEPPPPLWSLPCRVQNNCFLARRVSFVHLIVSILFLFAGAGIDYNNSV